ncbi:MAG TPA: MFS transporter [Chroococcales cyanobacterium]|jgi:PAT family beta-lactamase induction signal transducer AmpG
MTHQVKSRSPWMFIPTLYFAEGVPYVIINTVSIIFYKRMGLENAQIAFWTSLLYLPWVIKMFWSPLVDTYSTKRNWIIYTQVAMMCCLSFVAFSFQLPHFFIVSLLGLTLGAFISATHDIAADGFYLLALTQEQQAFFAGIRSVFYRLANIFGSGVTVVLAGQLEVRIKNISISWTLAIGLSALVFVCISIFHWFILPVVESDLEQKPKSVTEKIHFWSVIHSYFRKEHIGSILAFILLYRLGEALLGKIASPFLLERRELGGLGLSTSEVGIAYGTLGVISLIVGGIIGGVLISKYGLRKSIWPLTLAVHLPNLFYVYMAYMQPPNELVYLLVALDQLGYGLGFTAFSVYLMYISRGEYKTSHFAISTGFMALGMMLPGLISGYIQQAVGYPVFFIVVFLATIPGMVTLCFIPLKN